MKKTKSEKTCGGNWKVCPYAGLGNPPICKYEGYCDFQLPRDSRILVNGTPKTEIVTTSLGAGSDAVNIEIKYLNTETYTSGDKIVQDLGHIENGSEGTQ